MKKSRMDVKEMMNISLLNELNTLKQLYNDTFITNNQQTIPVVTEIVVEKPEEGETSSTSKTKAKEIAKFSDLKTEAAQKAFLTSMSTDQILTAARYAADEDIRLREDTVIKTLLILTKPDMDVEQTILTENVAEVEKLRLVQRASNLLYYAYVREDAKQKYHDIVSEINQKNEENYGKMSMITPSAWIKDFIEANLSTTARGILFQQFMVRKASPTNPELVTARTYNPDLHHILSRFASLFSIVTFIPHDSVRLSMRETVFSDTQSLIHYAASSNPDLVNYSDFLKRTYEHLTEPNLFANIKLAVLTSVMKLMNMREDHVFVTRGKKSIAPKNTATGSVVGVPHDILTDLLPFIIDNKAIYDLKKYEEKVKGDGKESEVHTRYRDTPIGRFLNFDHLSAAEFERTVKLIKKREGITEDVRVHVKSIETIGMLDCVRHIYTALMTAACTLTYIFTANFTKPLEELIIRFPETRRIQFVPSLEAYPGALFFNLLHEGGSVPVGIERYKYQPYMTSMRTNFALFFESFVRILPTLQDVKADAYTPTLKGVYTQKNPNTISFSTKRTEDMIQGLRYISIDELKSFKIRMKANMFESHADFLNQSITGSFPLLQAGSIPRNIGYFYDLLQSSKETGPVLGDKNLFNVPTNYATPESGFENFCRLPVVYRFETITVTTKKETRQTYTSALESENTANIYSALQSIIGGGEIRAERGMETE